MKALIAPNALKGSLSAAEATEIVAHYLPTTWQVILCPIADGGDGTLDCLVNATAGRMHSATVTGPYSKQPCVARWGEVGNRKAALIEMAEAAGLRLLKAENYSAANTTTFGVGELILKALDAGYRTIYVSLGGSATNDAGAGCAQALGVRLLDHYGKELLPGGIHLKELHTIDLSHRDRRLDACEFICLADVQNVLIGPSGASRVYGAQKGANPVELEILDDALRQYAAIIQKQLGIEVARLAGGGAAGGLGAGLNAFCRATIVSGIDHILDLIGFDELLRQCDIVLTAEGSLDEQTLHGKGIAGVARRAKNLNKPVHVFAGRVRGSEETLCRQLRVQSINQITPSTMGDAEAISRVRELLSLSVQEFSRTFR